MPIDLPPQAPAYHVERAAPVRQVDRAMFAAIAVTGERVATATALPIERMLPRMDPRSEALTREDREALLGASRANAMDRLSSGEVARPDSYVGERIALGVAYARAGELMARAELGAANARATRCRAIAVAMDPRAGRYVEGGERGAAAARAAIPSSLMEECAASVRAARARVAPPVAVARVVAPVRIDPVGSTRVRIDPVVRRVAPVSIEPTSSRRVSIDPTPSRRMSIDSSRLAPVGRGV